jgi:UDP-N-acetylmuramoyl-L-alanyl-D-glutamate--2,6-diaminopimelate ligase
MEVSSHALSLGRVDEITFDVAGFTNFGRDHLDFHGSLEAYFEAKAQLFSAGRARRAVINLDDARGPELVRRATDAGLDVATTSLAAAAADADAGHGPAARSHDQYRCLDHDPTADPVRVRIGTPQGELDFRLGLPGRFNVANAITALAMLDRIHVDLAAAAQGLATASVPGRLERIELGTAAPRAYVDFAHTPQAIGSVLAELRAGVGDGRLIAVLGCGGDRDPAKRGPMGAVAAQLADVVIITDDNPRSEDPADIRAAALAGAREQAAGADRPVMVLDGGDRAAAIRRALVIAGPADVVAVLGKGHERGQEIDGQVLPFDDAQQLRSAWQQSGTTPSQQTDQPEGGRP